MAGIKDHIPTTTENLEEFYAYLFAPWVKNLGLENLSVSEGKASAILPQKSELHWANGAICGQAIMAAIDTVAALAMTTSDRPPKGTASQNTQFLRPAVNDDLSIDVNVLKFGAVIAYAEAKVTFVSTGKLVAHATLEFVF